MSEQKRRSHRFVTPAEVAEEVGVTVATLDNWIARGEFPKPIRIGIRKRVWMRVEFEIYIAQRAAEAVNGTR